MFIKSFLIGLLLSSYSFVLLANTFEYENYNWEEKRTMMRIASADEKEEALLLKDKRGIEYIYNAQGAPECYKLIHKIIRVNTDQALESFNKVYISMQEVINIVDLKVRVITKEGKVIVLNKENIKEVENLENAGAYKIFAIEGAEKNCEIEYFYILHTAPSFYSREIFQSSIIARNVDFELISPINLRFISKSYNGLPEAIAKDSTNTEKRYIGFSVKEIPALHKEEFSTYNANKMRINYKLDANGKTKLFRWSTEAQANYDRVYYWQNQKALKPVEKMLKTIGITKTNTEEEKVIMIEHYIKNNILINDNVDKEGFFIESILDKKVASKFGMLRLMAAALTKAGIKHQLVITSDRNEEKFDPTFEYLGFLDNYLIYIESLDQYIAPYEYAYRYPFFPHYWSNNYGMYLNPVTTGKKSIAVDIIKFIPASNYQLSYHNHYLDIRFQPDLEAVNIKYKTTMSGHTAVALQPYLRLLTDEKRKEIGESLVKSSAEDGKVSNLQILHDEMNGQVPLLPLEINAEMVSSAVVEKAGAKYLLKVGELIGRQSELYQNTKRQQEVENSHNHGYLREITLNIPAGYKVSNLTDLHMEVFYEDKGERTMAFTSNYAIEGNKVKITVHEYYKNIIYPLSIFENFRKVINAAADFNKITLVLEKI